VYKRVVAAPFARDRAATVHHGHHLSEPCAPAVSTATQSREPLP
jgi:hypothetical protein